MNCVSNNVKHLVFGSDAKCMYLKEPLHLFHINHVYLHFYVHSGAQMEVDYTEKLNFSDDEENHTAKDKGDNW